jgi:hypothetical protein
MTLLALKFSPMIIHIRKKRKAKAAYGCTALRACTER